MRKLGAVAEHTSNYVSVSGTDRRIEWANAAFCEKTGYPLDELVGRNPAHFLRDDANDPELMAAIDRAAENGEGITCEVINRTRSGEIYWVELDIRPVHDAEGTLTGFVSIAVDITQRKAAEERMREASLMGEMLEESVNEIHVLDAVTLKFLYANRGARENLGYTLEELREMTVVDINPRLDLETVRERNRALLNGQLKYRRTEGRYRRKDGSTYDVDIHVQMAPGDPTRIVTYILDISERRKAEAQARDAQERLAIAIETLPDGFVLFDAEDRLVVCNERYRDIYRKSAPAMVAGAKFEDILRYGLERGEYANAAGREEEWLAKRMAAHRSADRMVEQQLSNGRWLRIVERRTPDGGMVGLRMDITEQLQSRERAERAEQRLIDAINALPAAFWLYDAEDRLVMFNDRYRDHYADPSFLRPGITYEEAVRHGVRQNDKADRTGSEDKVVARILSDRRTGHYEREYQIADGRWIRSYNDRTSDGGHVGFGIDITDARERQEKLRHAAQTDPLTGLANRRGLSARLEAIARSADEATRVAFMHVDLDRFKSVNDAVGHDAGDHVLQYCAEVLWQATRKDDLVARVGGDEFVVVCANAGPDSDIARMADRLVKRLSAPIPYGDKTCHTGASVGVAFWHPASEPDVQRRLTDADIALQQSKADGRGRYHFFEDAMRNRALLSAELAQDIFVGLERDEFEPFLQPQFDIATGAIAGFEALIRWHHPRRGLLAPADFLFAAEEANLMDALDQRMLERSCALLPELTAAGFHDPRISINMSGTRLSDPKIVERILATTASFSIEPRQLILEILETTLLDDRSAHVDENLRRLVGAGFALELDDFGTGHAAIANLRKYPLERIKIDRSLVAGIDRDVDLVTITSAITNLAKSLGLKVLAEGVETEAECEILRRIGCTSVQGYLFSHPMPFSSLSKWLRDRGPVAVNF